MMPHQKSKKIFIYFFLLLAVGSINNLTISDYKLEKIEHIEILGLNNLNKEQIKKEIKNLKIENIFNLNKKDIVNILNSNPLVESFEIFKKYPSTLYIDIRETKLIAKINKDNQTFYIGTNGKLSKKKL